MQSAWCSPASLAPVALKHAAAFEAWRDALAADVPERFRKALDAQESDLGRPKAKEARVFLRENRAIFGFLLVTAAMSLCGLSWFDILRKALAFL